MAITVTLPVPAITGLNAIVQEGGDLEPNTTYYYVIIAYNGNRYSPIGQLVFHSPLSAEGTFTTNNINKSAHIKWANGEAGFYYQVLISKTAGNYSNSRGYGAGLEIVSNITDGTLGIIVDNEGDSEYLFHSCQYVNNLISNIDKNLGTIKLRITGGNYYSLSNLYEEIKAQGFEEYARWDGNRLILKGSIVTQGDAAGGLYITNESLVLLKGELVLYNPNYIVQFGVYMNDVMKGDISQSCSIEVLNSRYPIKAYYPSVLKIYASIIKFSDNINRDFPENMKDYYYMAATSKSAGQTKIGYYIDEIKDSIVGIGFRSQYGPTKDLKIRQSNNYSGDYFRITTNSYINLQYTNYNSFYKSLLYCNLRMFINPNINFQYSTRFYDCTFPVHDNNIVKEIYWNRIRDFYSPNYISMLYSIIIDISNEAGDVLAGANINMADINGNAVEWHEKDGSYDEVDTGNIHTDVNADDNGHFDMYVQAYKIASPIGEPIGSIPLGGIFTSYYPFTLTISKSGYQNYKAVIKTLSDITYLHVVLKKTIPTLTFSITRLLSRIFSSGKKITSQELITEGAVEHSAALQEHATITNTSRATYRPSSEDILLEQQVDGVWQEAEVIAEGAELVRESASIVDDVPPIYINQKITGEVMEAEVIEGIIEETLIIGEIIS